MGCSSGKKAKYKDEVRSPGASSGHTMSKSNGSNVATDPVVPPADATPCGSDPTISFPAIARRAMGGEDFNGLSTAQPGTYALCTYVRVMPIWSEGSRSSVEIGRIVRGESVELTDFKLQPGEGAARGRRWLWARLVGRGGFVPIGADDGQGGDVVQYFEPHRCMLVRLFLVENGQAGRFTIKGCNLAGEEIAIIGLTSLSVTQLRVELIKHLAPQEPLKLVLPSGLCLEDGSDGDIHLQQEFGT